MPLHECILDCWNTSKGETQTTVQFKPVEVLGRASAISRSIRPHAISDHPGFDANLAHGSLTLNIRHKLDYAKLQQQTPEAATAPIANDRNQQQQQQQDNLRGEDASLTDEKRLSGTIADELIAQYERESDINKRNVQLQMRNNINGYHADVKDDIGGGGGGGGGIGGASSLVANDDSQHKFVQVHFSDYVTCEFCTKKIWFRNAYQCTHCGYVIHLKCYDKAIEKSTCQRFLANTQAAAAAAATLTPIPPQQQNSAADLPPAQLEAEARSISPSRHSVISDSSFSIGSASSSSRRNLVSSFLSGLRHRRKPTAGESNQEQAHPQQQQQQQQQQSYTGMIKSSSFLNTINMALKSRTKPKTAGEDMVAMNVDEENEEDNDEDDEEVEGREEEGEEEEEDNDDDDEEVGDEATEAFDDNGPLIKGGGARNNNKKKTKPKRIREDKFKDTDASGEHKLYGNELFDDLALDERRLKFEEMVRLALSFLAFFCLKTSFINTLNSQYVDPEISVDARHDDASEERSAERSRPSRGTQEVSIIIIQ